MPEGTSQPRQSRVVTANEYIGQDAAVAILELKAENDRLLALATIERRTSSDDLEGWEALLICESLMVHPAGSPGNPPFTQSMEDPEDDDA